ncbi:MAG: hypothetical protein GKR89_31400 [Candidatus Latescibacteria bacterium]|nr:hypothetical protein [Candidatus Latescibacterota bacterium]
MALEAWMRIGQPLEPVMDDYPRIFEAWEEGGVRGLVFGRLTFADAGGKFTIPALSSDLAPYQNRGIAAQPQAVAADPGRVKQLHAMLANAKERGWQVMIFSPGSPTRPTALPAARDPYGAVGLAAAWEEIFTAFPEADGGIQDGWTESAYELQYHHGNAVFRDIPETTKAQAEQRGFDAARLEKGMRHLLHRFQNLTSAQVGYYGAHGVLAAMNLFDINEDALYWLRWRRRDGIDTGRAFRDQLNQLPRPLLLGNGPRSAAFSGMTALDFLAWDEICDILLVKHYFWHRGFDGLYGTVARWVKQVHDWNPELTESDCFAVVKAWLGIDLPEVNKLADMDLGFPQAFFDQIVPQETRRALAAVADPRKIVPWVDTGRMPHGGDPMTAGDLHQILTRSQEAGLQRFLFHNHGHLTAAEWCVLSRLCGSEWNEDPKGYWPPATPKPSAY